MPSDPMPPVRFYAVVMLASVLPALADDFAGAAQCGACHAAQFEKQRRSRHAASLRPILQSSLAEILVGRTVRESNGLQFEYRAAPGGILVTVSRGRQQSAGLLEWAFGDGAQGITPVGRVGGQFFEHRVSWYPQQARAGLTMGHSAAAPASMAACLGQNQAPAVIRRCFGCHASGIKDGPELSAMRPGIDCERCHGPGAQHVSRPSAGSIHNPGRLPVSALVAACGECHRLPESGGGPSAAELARPETIRFAPIGLMASRCYQASGRLSCLTCHDPHEDARTDAQFYTAKCLGCHRPQVRGGKNACRRAAGENCLPCHMPRSSPLPYLEFTDHRIRIVRAAQPLQTTSWEPVEKAIAAGDWDRARRLLEALPSVHPKWHLLASKIQDGLDDPARAVAEAQAAIELAPGNLAAYLQLGQIFLSHNTPQPAAEVFTEALRIDPASVLARLGKGLALKDLQLFEEAEKELSGCLEQNPQMAVAFDALAGTYLAASDTGKLAAMAERYMQTNPSDYRGYYYLAAAKEHAKEDVEGAEKLLRRSLELNENFAASYALLGKLLIPQNRLREAAAALERAIRLRPDYRPAHLYLANAYRKMGRDHEAEREFQAVRDLNEKESSRPNLIYHRGSVRN
jgi:tetratricopeptide (TPR) repeat protein